MRGRGGVTRKVQRGPPLPQKEKAPQRAGPLLGAFRHFTSEARSAGRAYRSDRLAGRPSGILRLLARLLVRLSALLTGGLATLVLLVALLILILVGH